MWLTLIPVHELKIHFALGPEDTDTLVKLGEARSGQPSVQNYGACEFIDDLYHMIDTVIDHYLSKQ